MDWDQVRNAADGRWFEILTSLGVDGGLLHTRHGACPGCGGSDRFRWPDKGRGEWFCSGGGGDVQGGDGFALLGHVHGWDKGRQLREVANVLGIEDRELTPAERAEYARKRESAERARAAAERGRHLLRALERVTARYRVRYAQPEGCMPLPPEAVRQRARALWGSGTELEPGSRAHPYLERKAVGAYGLKVHKSNGTLMVPVRQVGGQLIGLQFLPADPAGSKTFLKDMAPMAGGLHIIGEVDPEGWLGIAEGYATGASLHECELRHVGRGLPVAVAWSAGMLEAAGRALLARWPRLKLLWLADWDDDVPGNPGVSAASWAAEVCGGMVLPGPGVAGAKLDWNDALVSYGADFVAAAWITQWECAVDGARARAARDLEVLRGLLRDV